jgi:cytochrome c oxidase subunit 3
MTAESLTMPRRLTPVPAAPEPAVSNTRLAIVIVITAETMLFTGLIGMYLVFRLSAPEWPPPDLPRLPATVAALNTLVLFASLVPLTRALMAVRRGKEAGRHGVHVAAALGTVFLAVQGAEWLRLLRHGLTPGSSNYGGAFYLLIGCHAVHVLVAVLWLAIVAVLAERGYFSARRYAGFEMSTIYWYFVCGLWGFLFPLVYLY